MSGSCAQSRWEQNLEVLKQGGLCGQKGEDRLSRAAGWRPGWHPGTHRVLWAEDPCDVVLEGLQCTGPTPLLLLEGRRGCASAVHPTPAASRAHEARLTHRGGDRLPILWQRQGRQGVPGAQLCQLPGQHVPLQLQLGLGTEAALELLPRLMQPLPPAQQVHPGEGTG